MSAMNSDLISHDYNWRRLLVRREPEHWRPRRAIVTITETGRATVSPPQRGLCLRSAPPYAC